MSFLKSIFFPLSTPTPNKSSVNGLIKSLIVSPLHNGYTYTHILIL